MANPQQFSDKLVLTGKEPIEEIAYHIRNKVAIYHEQNLATYRQWLLNSAYSRGQQWGVVGSKSNVFEPLSPPSGLNFVVEDMIGPWKRATVANLSIGQPQWEAVPKSYDPSAIMGARTAQDILDAYWDEWRFIEKEIAGNDYLLDFANFLIFVRYDENEADGEIIMDADSGEPIYDENNAPVKQRVKVGKISSDIRPPQHLGCPLDPRDLDDKEWIFWRESRSLTYYRSKYPKQGDKVMPEGESFREYSDTTLPQINRKNDDIHREQTANEVLFMQKPNDINPDGLVIPYANNVVLELDPEKWRWQFDDMTGYPVIHVHGPKNAGEFWARSSIETQIPLQRALNLSVSSMADNMDMMAHMKWGIPASSGVTDMWDDNEVITFDGTQAPAMLKVEALPNWMIQFPDQLRAAIRNIQSWHGASQGSSVSGVRSDLHAQNLQDQDALPYTTLDNLKAAGYARHGDKILRIRAEKMPDQPMSFVKDGRPIVIQNFNATMMGSVARINVKMVGTNMRSKGAVKQEIAQWFQAGLLVDPMTGMPDALKTTELLEFALPGAVFEQRRIHSNQAYMENIKMYQGEAPKPYPFENHFIHQQVHGDEMNSPRFRQLLEAAEKGDPEATKTVQLFYGHIQVTSQIQAEAYGQIAPPPEEQENKQTQGATQKRQTAEES